MILLPNDRQLSPHFMASEFMCPCCGASEVNQKLVDGLEQLRVSIKLPITVTSGRRCLSHNKQIGGARGSQHLLGNAADIYVRGIHPLDLYRAITAIRCFLDGGVGIGNGIVHVDVRNGRTRWSYDAHGKEVPFSQWKYYGVI